MKVKELIEILEGLEDFEIEMWEYDHDSSTLGTRKEPVVNITRKTSKRGKAVAKKTIILLT